MSPPYPQFNLVIAELVHLGRGGPSAQCDQNAYLLVIALHSLKASNSKAEQDDCLLARPPQPHMLTMRVKLNTNIEARQSPGLTCDTLMSLKCM